MIVFIRQPRYLNSVLLGLVLLFFLPHCQRKERVLMTPIGVPGNIVVVNFSSYPLPYVDSLFKQIFNKPLYGLPQNEFQADITVIDKTSFGKTFRAFRNIFLVQDQKPQNAILYKENVWASEQWVVFFNTLNQSGLEGLIHQFQAPVFEKMNALETSRLIQKNQQYPNTSVKEAIKKKYGINLDIQDGYEFVTQNEYVFWLRLEREREQGGFKHQISQGLLYCSLPYTDTSQLNPAYINYTRDSLLKKYMHGELDSSYIETVKEFVPPRTMAKIHKGNYTLETRGLWHMVNGVKMGGPFLNMLYVDTSENKLHLLEGYVYAPNFKKREYLRELEAMMTSFKKK